MAHKKKQEGRSGIGNVARPFKAAGSRVKLRVANRGVKSNPKASVSGKG
jgi:hypothetical protein